MKAISYIKDKHLLKIIKELKENIVDKLGSSLKVIVLYGSYARNEQDNESDIDIMIFIDEKASVFDARRKISDIRVNLSLKYDIVLSIIVKNYKTFHNNVNVIPFYSVINKEGIEIYEQ